MDSLQAHQDYLLEAWAAAQAAPLSVRKAMLVAGLLDAQVDRLFTRDAGDILAFRAIMAEQSPALGAVMALCSRRDGFDVVVEAVAVPLSAYQQLSVQDFMVSLYNDHTVQKLNLVLPDGARREMHGVLSKALDALKVALNNPTR
ncbi:MAG: hypothetical protein P0Y65_10955 [Candidatus Devosia phytovorans]|uniref:Uncharacterized protein n=1 Tax=Candidatus Devosia phytovorans TaxID=3121372 RepID=A0AAJ5VR55_9HYPH|nr:hypothetical protein [Devosia sp.]WEK02727.1 MAG: hypothetical protein P0Y65_10955 [Devosia sp.]